MTVTDLFGESILRRLPIREPLAEDDLKRLPPLFYDEDSDIENLLLIHKFVALHNPMLEVYLYEHENDIFSAMFVERHVDAIFFSLAFVELMTVEQPNVFEHIQAFKPRTIGEFFNEMEASGHRVHAEDFLDMQADLGEQFFLTESD